MKCGYFEKLFGWLNSNLKGELLWTNNNPTVKFPHQNISIDLNKYSSIKVVFRASNTNTTTSSVVIPIDSTDKVLGVNYTTSAETYTTIRSCMAASSYVRFGDGYVANRTTHNGGYNDNMLIPLEVYGCNIKF